MAVFSIEKFLPWRIQIQMKKIKRHNSIKAILKTLHPHAKTISKAVEKTVTKKYSSEELTFFENIEHLRKLCLGSDEKIKFIDYGAGEPSAPRSIVEARQGVAKTIDLSHLAKHTSKNSPWSDLLFNLIRELRPLSCIELGTCIGFSAAYQCAAMSMNFSGSLVSLEGAPSFAAKATKHLHQIGLNNFDIIVGRFEDTLEKTLIEQSPFDFMFNDGHHDGKAMLNYFEMCLPYFSKNAVILFDDISAYPSMQNAWKELLRHERVVLAIDFGPMGLVALGKRGKSMASVIHLEI